MVFSSLIFLFLFLPIVLIINFLLPSKLRNGFLLIANLFFYAWGEPIYVLLMLASIFVNYISALLIDNTDENAVSMRKFILVVNVILNIGALGFFKYTSLVMDTLRLIPAFGFIPKVNILLPIGISFYTFQAMSYVIDVYRKDCGATKNFIDFASYISLFPQLIAGPIVRYVDVKDQMTHRVVTMDMFSSGVKLFVVGLAKKVLLANQFGKVWDMIFADALNFGTAGAWVGALSYTLQIYFDFAGYSDMARGLGKMLGFDFCINFNYPYISRNITEFWRRWHISLSTWFKDYIYIPLGGNRTTKARHAFNVLVVWALTGLGHGAGWNFVAWGLYYGLLLLAEKMLYGKLLEKLPRIFGHLYTMLIVIVGWIFFASPTFADAFNYIKCMFVFSSGDAVGLIPWFGTFAIGIVCATPLCLNVWTKAKEKCNIAWLEVVFAVLGFLLCLARLVTDSYNPFLYFRF